jgi:hypothetical protein
MVVVVFQALGVSPEEAAWRKLAAWAEPLGLLADPGQHPIYGYNNPPPEAVQPEYGYELWIEIDPDMPVPAELCRQEFAGGRYAATTCRLVGDPLGTLPDVWQMLLHWVQASPYRWSGTHELEHLVNPGAGDGDLVLELLLPIDED